MIICHTFTWIHTFFNYILPVTLELRWESCGTIEYDFRFFFFKFYFILFSIASCWKVVCMYDSWIRERDSKYDSRRSVVLVVGSCTKNRRILEFKCETSGVKFHIARTMWKWRVFVQARTKVKVYFLVEVYCYLTVIK